MLCRFNPTSATNAAFQGPKLSEHGLQGHLHDAGRLRAADLPHQAVADSGVGVAEIGAVERVAQLPAKAEVAARAEVKIPMHPQVDVELTRPEDETAAGVAESELGRHRKGREVEPAIRWNGCRRRGCRWRCSWAGRPRRL